MNPSDAKYVSDLIRERAGIELASQESYLFENKLGPLARREGYGSVSAMIGALRTRRDVRLAALVTGAMTSAETWFFRDRAVFDRFAEHALPALAAAKRPGECVRIWSAGCSTGQEAYSLAMIAEAASSKIAGRSVEIVATDISALALEKAKAGVYSQFEVQRGLPIRKLVEYFDKQDQTWRVRSDLKRFMRFAPLNLLDPFDGIGRVDAVFCRNVLSSFAPETRRAVLTRVAAHLNEGGRLILGAQERLEGCGDLFTPEPECPSEIAGVFVRTQAQAAAA